MTVYQSFRILAVWNKPERTETVPDKAFSHRSFFYLGIKKND